MTAMKIMILAGQKNIFEGDAREVVLPGEDGEFSVMDHHAPCLYALRGGQVKVRAGGAEDIEEKIFPVKAGVAKVDGGRLVVMMESF